MKYKATTSTTKSKKTSYPSEYGSHASMINENFEGFNDAGHDCIVCTDDRGNYITERKHLDSGLCDYNRSVNIEARDARFDAHFDVTVS